MLVVMKNGKLMEREYFSEQFFRCVIKNITALAL